MQLYPAYTGLCLSPISRTIRSSSKCTIIGQKAWQKRQIPCLLSDVVIALISPSMLFVPLRYTQSLIAVLVCHCNPDLKRCNSVTERALQNQIRHQPNPGPNPRCPRSDHQIAPSCVARRFVSAATLDFSVSARSARAPRMHWRCFWADAGRPE